MKVFLAAGEASGDALGGAMMPYFPDGTEFFGIGGAEMRREGLASLFPMNELSVMGLAEIVPHAPQLLRRLRETADAIADLQPDVVITIDSPDFATRVARRVSAARPDIPRVHYVAPSVWAWRAGRAKTFSRLFHHLLALLPFEPPYFEAEGLSCTFVGHPVVSLPDVSPAALARPRLVLLPGSRASEIKRLAPLFAEVAARLESVDSVVVAAPGCAVELRKAMPGLDVRTPANAVEKYEIFASADAALAASGTVSLELARYGTPMAVAYDANRLTRFLVKRLVRIETATLVNLLTESRAIPEFLFENCRVEKILPTVEQLVHGHADSQKQAMEAAMLALGKYGPPPGARAAEAVLSFLARR